MALILDNPITQTESSYVYSDTSFVAARSSNRTLEHESINWEDPAKLNLSSFSKTDTEPGNRLEVNPSGSKSLKSEDNLMRIWLKHTVSTMYDYNDDSLSASMQKSERYLKALYNNDEYRMVVSIHILNLRSSGKLFTSNENIRKQYAIRLEEYWNSQRSSADRMKFLRAIRSMNVSPSGA